METLKQKVQDLEAQQQNNYGPPIMGGRGGMGMGGRGGMGYHQGPPTYHVQQGAVHTNITPTINLNNNLSSNKMNKNRYPQAPLENLPQKELPQIMLKLWPQLQPQDEHLVQHLAQHLAQLQVQLLVQHLNKIKQLMTSQ